MTTARRIRIEYDFSVTSRSTSVVDRIDTKTKNLNTTVTRTTNSIKNFSQSLNGVHAPARRATSSLMTFSNAVSNVSRSVGYAFRNMFSWRTLFIGFATGNVIGAAKRALIDYNVEMDNFRQGISMSLNQMTDWEKSFGGVSSAQERWNKSMIGSQAIMSNLRKYAAQSIGSVKEYAEAFQLINSQIMAIGGTSGDSLEVAKRLVPLTKASGRDIMTGAMDINQILRGDPNLRQINLPALRDPRVLELSKLARGNPKKGVGGDPKLAMEKLLEILKESDVGVKAYAKTYQAQLETLTDNLQVFAAKVGEPIFNRITKEMTDFNKGWASTEAALKRSGEKFGKFLVDAFDKGKEGLSAFILGLKQVGASVLTLTQAMIGLRLAGMASGVASMATSKAATAAINFPGLASAASYAGSSLSFLRGKSIGNLPPINTNAAGAGRIGVPGSPGGTSTVPVGGVVGAGAQGAGKVSQARGIFGSAILGAIGFGIALSIVTDRTKELARQEGYLGQMAKNTGEIVRGVGDIFKFLADVSIGLVGSIGQAARAIGIFAAQIAGYNVGNQGRSFGKTAVGQITSQVQPVSELNKSQNEQIKTIGDRLFELYGNDPESMQIIGAQLNKFSKPTGTTQAEKLLAIGDVEGAFRHISSEVIKHRSPSKRRELIKQRAIELERKRSYFDKRRNPVTKELMKKYVKQASEEIPTSLPLNDQIIAGAIASGQITPEEAKRSIEILGQLSMKRQEQVVRIAQDVEQTVAEQFKGRQKAENKFDFSNATININQDFKNEDPDRVYIKFAQDIGLVSATMIQSRLSPIVR